MTLIRRVISLITEPTPRVLAPKERADDIALILGSPGTVASLSAEQFRALARDCVELEPLLVGHSPEAERLLRLIEDKLVSV